MLLEQFTDSGGGITAIKIDFLSPDFVKKIPREIDVLINNAGIYIDSPNVEKTNLDDYDKVMDVNLRAPFLLTKHILPHMRNQNWGRIININSNFGMSGELASCNSPAYTMSKFGLTGLTKIAAVQYTKFGITSNEISPGAVESEIWHKNAERAAAKTGRPIKEIMNEWQADSPSGRIAKPEEIASLAKYLASEEAAHMNGVSIALDGGGVL